MEVSASGNFSKLAHAVRSARRRVGPPAAANLGRFAVITSGLVGRPLSGFFCSIGDPSVSWW